MRQLDLCTGSGCVAIAMARQRPTAQVFASDLSPAALAVARDNALRLGAYNVAFVESDLFAAFSGGRQRAGGGQAPLPGQDYEANAQITTYSVAQVVARQKIGGEARAMVVTSGIERAIPTALR